MLYLQCMKFPLFIALRYLQAKKSHNVINMISAVSVAGMAIGTAALITILSVFNGFSDLVDKTLGDLDPDLLVTPREGKFFTPSEKMISVLEQDPAVQSVLPVLSENVFVSYAGRQSVALARGVGDGYEAVSALGTHIIEGELKLHFGELKQCCLGSSLARELGAHPQFSDRLEVYYPNREGGISMADPVSSLNVATVFPSGIAAVNSETDQTLLVLPIEVMRELCSCADEVTALEIRLSDKSPRAVRALSRKVGEEFVLLDRAAQHPETYRMMKYEKLAVFLILLFVVIIISFNIFGSLTMLIIEKKEDARTLSALGATPSVIRRIFVLEGWLISLSGLTAGLVLGIGLCLVQRCFGVVKMPEGFLMEAYPVIINPLDILITCAGVAFVGLAVALAAVRIPDLGRVRPE